MHDATDHAHIVFNGEIYNFGALREKIGKHKFRTRSDTEAILHLGNGSVAPHQWVPQLDGMFAFALARGPDFVLARDPLGIKPLYVGRGRGRLAFASEIKALLPLCDTVAEFPPGHVFSTMAGLRRYSKLSPAHAEREPSVDDACTEILRRLEHAVEKRLVADVPVGVFLSGGLDSSLIAALASRHKRPLDTFCVGTAESEDLRVAREVAALIGSRHHERSFTIAEALAVLPEVIYRLESFDCALVRSAIPNYMLAKHTSDHVKVALSGEGADELFAGYEYLRRFDLDALNGELLEITNALHNTNLQRCDRMSMAHGLEVRVPFLDMATVTYAFQLPVALKQRRDEQHSKWILRKAAERVLPAHVAWRAKTKFAVGSGLGDALGRLADTQISDAAFQREREISDGFLLRSKEELFYYRHFKQLFPAEKLLPLIGRSHSV